MQQQYCIFLLKGDLEMGQGGGGVVKQTRGSRTQPINGSQNEWIEVKLNEQNANSCLLPTQNLTAGL